MGALTFTDSELFCIKDAMLEFKKNNAVHCCGDGVAEIERIIDTVDTEIKHRNGFANALQHLFNKEYLEQNKP